MAALKTSQDDDTNTELIMEFTMKQMRAIKVAIALSIPLAALCYLLSFEDLKLTVKSEGIIHMALIRSDRSIMNIDHRAWYSELLPKRTRPAIA